VQYDPADHSPVSGTASTRLKRLADGFWVQLLCRVKL